MSVEIGDALRARVKSLEAMPAMPAIVAPLLSTLELPPDKIDIDKVSELISHDKSVAAQCLRMVNSPLFGRHRNVESIRAAVIALGARKLRDVIWSCYMVKLSPKMNWPIDPVSFWEHSFACALVSQRLAEKISAPDPDKAYLCGLLHDIGEIVNVALIPDEFRAALEKACARNLALYDTETETIGFSHCETGSLLADYWALPESVKFVIAHHHHPERAPSHESLVALVNLADLLCRLRGMGYGYTEMREVYFREEPAWTILLKHAPHLERLDIFRLTMELEEESDKIRELVSAAFSGS
jgi:putative nucleotidyltransferase with HDIG domain